MPKLVLCLSFWIRGCRANPVKDCTLSGFLDMMMPSSSCLSWYFVWGFGYEDVEFIMSKLVPFLGFWIRRCREHPDKVGTLSRFLNI